jgi:catechol 2,3-dioxygenase-like lactoylglutathione lyase family enzyme
VPEFKHIAIVCKDPVKMGEFYQAAFGLQLVHQAEGGTTTLSDGSFNLTLLNWRADLPNHFGIQMTNEEIEAARPRLEALGATYHEPRRDGVRSVEIYVYDPEGNRVDMAPHWAITPGEVPGRADEMMEWDNLKVEKSQLGKRAAELAAEERASEG